jgi:hypothetical protein
MKRAIQTSTILLCILIVVSAVQGQNAGRDPNQPIDEAYTKKILEYTTLPAFLSPLVNYLPGSKSVPTPQAVIGDIAGAPGKLPYTADVHRYMRMLEKASPRVKVYAIGTSEEGREMIAVAVSSEANLGKLEENRARLALLADPRKIKMDDSEAARLVAASVPVYYITGALHAPETGSPTALMELAYRLAVDESSYIRAIRDGLITLITPVVETDGRDRQCDIYNWHLAHPKDHWPPLIYWGRYVAHDNNRDAMNLSLKLSQNVLNTYVGWNAQVLHDLHESVPYLYDNTVGDGPYNAWIDPIVADEWQLLGYNNVMEMTRFNMPGVFAHGTFDAWSPGYMNYIAVAHNGVSRLYETFGNGGADTVERVLTPLQYERTWYRQNPPLPKALWSQRNNNNYQVTGLLVALSYFAANNRMFLNNFYLKSKRAIEKPKTAGPAAYVFPGDDPRPGLQAEVLRVLQRQGCEIHRATAPFTVMIPAKKTAPPKPEEAAAQAAPAKKEEPPAPQPRQFPAGSYVVRMDQPFSRIADTLLDYQYWSPNDPQKNPYDDTGWTLGELANIQAVRVTEAKVLEAAMQPVAAEIRTPGGIEGTGAVFLLNHNADTALMTLRYRLRAASIDAAEEPFEAAGLKFGRGSFLLRNVARAEVERAVVDLGLRAYAVESAPTVKTHPLRAARIALLHTWLDTQDEGWWRQAFDLLKIPFTYISTQDVAKDPNLNARFDAIIFGPVGRNPSAILAGMPMWGNPLPWKTTPLTPNIGKIDATDDMRPGLGWSGIANLEAFARRGGLLLTTGDTSDLAVTYGLTPGVGITRPAKFKAAGSVLKGTFVDAASPIAYGYGDNLSVYCNDGLIFWLTNIVGGRGPRSAAEIPTRATGRGTPDDPDIPQNRAYVEPVPEPKAEPWQALPLTDEQRRNGFNVIPPRFRPRVVLRYGDAKDLLVSGLLDGGGEIAQRPAVVDVPIDRGHIVLFSNNPMWRAATHGSYFLVFNAILNFDSLNAGRKLEDK